MEEAFPAGSRISEKQMSNSRQAGRRGGGAHTIFPAAHTTSAKEAMPVEKRRKEDTPMDKAREMSQFTAVKTDPQGSWTGCPADPYEVPVQDADDL